MKKITSILMLFLMCFGMAVQAGPTDLPELTTDSKNPKLYTIKNVRQKKFASYVGASDYLAQNVKIETSAQLFYFQGTESDGKLIVKIHNQKAKNLALSEFNSWTETGKNWYIKAHTFGDKEGFVISTDENFSGNTCMNDHNGQGIEIHNWNADDPGSIFEIAPFDPSVAAVEQFSNHFVYTVQSPRGWMAYKEGCTNVVSTAKYKDLQTGNDVAACQWAVYKSVHGNYYMYNMGAKQFLGFCNDNNKSIPFSVEPQTNILKFKASTGAKHEEYPLMPYIDGVTSINHNGEFGDGLIAWTGGLDATADEGSIHKFIAVGTLLDEDLKLIENAVNNYESTSLLKDLQNRYKQIQGYVGGLSIADTKQLLELKSLEEANNFIEAHLIPFTPNQLYRLKNVKRPTGTLCVDDNGVLTSEPYNTQNANNVWSFKKLGNGKFNLMHANFAKGVTKPESHNLNEEVAEYELIDQTAGQFSLKSGNFLVQYQDGAGQIGDWYSAEKNGDGSWYIIPATELDVDMHSANEATWSSLYLPFDVTLPAELEAYTGKLNGSSLSMTKVNDVPANNGVILKGKAAKYTLNIAKAKTKIAENSLKGTNVKKDNIDKNQFYILGNTAENGIGLYHPNSTILKANRAYVEAGIGAQILKFDFNGETTGVEGVEVETEESNAAYYDLSGRRVVQPVRGVYIKNGKKVYVK